MAKEVVQRILPEYVLQPMARGCGTLCNVNVLRLLGVREKQRGTRVFGIVNN